MQVPRPRHKLADSLEQKIFKEKRLSERLSQVKQQYSKVALWAFDEHRLGLKPIIKRVWVKKGQRPITKVYHRYEWLYLYAFVCPQTGETYWCIMPRANICVYTIVIKEFAKAVGASKEKGVIVVLDQAGWHSKKELPAGIELEFLPSRSPELQPAERLWELTDDPLANKYFETLDDLEAVLKRSCENLMQNPDLITQQTLFHWWPIF